MPSFDQVDENWIRDHGCFLRRLGRALLEGDPEGEDAAQDAFAAALAHRRRGGGVERLAGWLHTVTRRRAARVRRQHAVRDESERRAARPEAQASAADAAARAEIVQRVAAVVAGLREPYREALLLRFFEDLPPRAIAARLGVPVRTVDSRIQRGLALARGELERTSRSEARRWSEALGVALGIDGHRTPAPPASVVPKSALPTALVAMKLPLALLACALSIAIVAHLLPGTDGDGRSSHAALPVVEHGSRAASTSALADGERVAMERAATDGAAPAQREAQALSRLRFRLVDTNERALAGVRGVWIPNSVAEVLAEDELASTIRATSDADGALALDVPAESGGTVRFRLDGYAPESRSLARSTAEPWTVTLRPSAEQRALRFVTFESGVPVRDVRLFSFQGHIATSGSDGVVQLPTWVDPREVLRAESSTTSPIVFQPGNLLREEVRLRAECEVTLDFALASGEDVGTVSLACHIPGASGPSAWVVYPWKQRVEGGSAVVRLPRDVEVTFSAIDELGRGAEATHVFRAPNAAHTLTLDASGNLDVILSDEHGAPIVDATAELDFLGSEHEPWRIRSDARGTLHVPNANRVQGIRIEAEGYGRVLLRATHDGTPREGAVALTLEREVTGARVRVVDASGAGLAGARVQLSRKGNLAAFRQFPELHGAWPSAHGAWGIWGIAFDGTTDEQGHVDVRGLAAGECDLAATIPRASDDAGDLFRPTRMRIDLRSNATTTIETERAVAVELEAFDASTGRPVRELTLRIPGGGETQVVGNQWQGWLAGSERELVLIAPGVGTTRVALDGDGHGFRRVDVWPEEPSLIRVVGDGIVQKLAGVRIPVTLFEPYPGGAFGSIGWRETKLDGNGVGRVLVAVAPPILLGLESVLVDGRRIRFEPDMLEWNPAAELTFTAVDGDSAGPVQVSEVGNR